MGGIVESPGKAKSVFGQALRHGFYGNPVVSEHMSFHETVFNCPMHMFFNCCGFFPGERIVVIESEDV